MLGLTLLCTATLNAQSVLPNDPVYALLDQLIAARIITPTTISHRPLSEERVRSILDQALSRIAVDDSSLLATQIRMARRAYAPLDSIERRITPQRLDVEARVAHSPTRGIPPDGNGAIDVDLNPLLGNRLGVKPIPGAQYATSLAEAYRFDRHFNLTAGGTAIAMDGGRDELATLDLLNLRALFGNAAITIGRDNQFFGQGVGAGLTNSLNPRAFDLVRVQNEAPFKLPWILHLLGPMDATAYLADLGGAQRFPHTHLFSYKLSARPVSSFELGATVADQIGGRGAPGGTFLDKVEDVFPLLDATILHRTLVFSNKFVGVDGRWLIPGSLGAQTYMEGVFDDFDLRRFKSSLTEDAGYIWGLSADCLLECGKFRAIAEYHTTGLRYYTHGLFTSGYTLDHQFIGDQLGPRGQAGYLTLDAGGVRHRVALNSAYEIRSGDAWGSASTTSNDSDFHFILIQHHPAERRWRSVVSVSFIGPILDQFTVSGGGERVENFDFQPGWRTNWIAQVALTGRLHGQMKRLNVKP